MCIDGTEIKKIDIVKLILKRGLDGWAKDIYGRTLEFFVMNKKDSCFMSVVYGEEEKKIHYVLTEKIAGEVEKSRVLW